MLAKNWQKNTVRVIAFLLAALAAVLLAGHYLMPTSNRYLTGYTAGGILGEDYDTVDVLVMGDSNAAQGIAPMQWYESYGFTGYTYGVGWLSVYNIYYRLRQIYAEQSPKVVVLCTDPVFSKKSSETTMQSAVGDIADELLPLLRFHDNWKQVTAQNAFAEKDYSWRDVNKGYTALTEVSPWVNGAYMYSTGTREEIPFLVRLYLQRILALCADNGSEVLLITVPAASGWNLARHNAVAEFAAEEGLSYLDYNMAELDPGIDWSTDTPDAGAHLNCLGAAKLTAALGAALTERYTLPDHRGAAEYAAWQADADACAAQRGELETRAQENTAALGL